MPAMSPASRRRLPMRLAVFLLIVALLIQPGAGVLAAHAPASVPPVTRAGVGTPAPGKGDRDAGLYDGIAAPYRPAIEAKTAGHLSRYTIDVTVTPATDGHLTRLAGTVDLLFVNTLTTPLETLVFRLYANDPRYGDGDIEMDDVWVGADPVTPGIFGDDTIATLALSDPVQPGDTVHVTYGFTAQVANDPVSSYGMFTYSPESGTLALAHWYPILSGFTDAGAWNVEPVSVNGDPIFSDTSLYDVSITMPDAWKIAASGQEIDTARGGDGTSHRFVTGPSRDFTFVADATMDHITDQVGSIQVVSWYNPGQEDGARQVLETGARTLETFQPLLGDYPYTQLDLVDVSVGNGAAGIEFPQLVFIGGTYYDDTPDSWGYSYLDSLVTHEVLHQWFYGLVGNDQYQHAFMDEGMADFLMAWYFKLTATNEAWEICYLGAMKRPYLSYLFNTGDVVVDQPTDSYASMNLYNIAVYEKGGVAFNALREVIGDDAFFTGLRTYVATYLFGVATPDQMLAAFEAASGQDLGAFWDHWFEQPDGRDDFSPADLNAATARLQQLTGSA